MKKIEDCTFKEWYGYKDCFWVKSEYQDMPMKDLYDLYKTDYDSFDRVFNDSDMRCQVAMDLEDAF